MTSQRNAESSAAGRSVPAANGLVLHYDEFEQFRELAYRLIGMSLTDAKQVLVASRLAARVRNLALPSYQAYHDQLVKSGDSSKEVQEFISALTTNKTDFFREPHHFDFLRNTVIPRVIARGDQGGTRRLRIWSAACSTGQEPYTIGITILEQFGTTRGWDVKILATDIDQDVLQRAEAGIYREEHIADIPLELRSRYLLRGSGSSEGLYKVRPEVQRLVTFKQLNLNGETWPVEATFDVIFCRNVVIYFDHETQDRLFRRFARYLDPEGNLIIGHSESLHWLSGVYDLVGPTTYRLAGSASGPEFAPVALRRPPLIPQMATAARPSVPPAPRAVPRTVTTDDGEVVPEVRIDIGGVHASREPAMVKTLLGSCIAVCLFDPVAAVGGMNHFLLPEGLDDGLGVRTRFGVHAMEVLINEVMKKGGDRRRFVAKVFGGGNVLNTPGFRSTVPQANAAFIKQFLTTEKIPIKSQRLGGTQPVEVRFFTHTGRALVRPVGAGATASLAAKEAEFRVDARNAVEGPAAGSVTLF